MSSLTDKQRRMIAILAEVATSYTSNIRSIDRLDKCLYENKNGICCAFGRFVLPNRRDGANVVLGASVVNRRYANLLTMFSEHPDKVDNILVGRAKGLGVEFWIDVQRLHDRENNWNEYGLSDVGKQEVKLINRKIREGSYDETQVSSPSVSNS